MDWLLYAILGLAAIYFVALIAGHGFGAGYFGRKARHQREFLNQLESRSKKHGTEEE